MLSRKGDIASPGRETSHVFPDYTAILFKFKKLLSDAGNQQHPGNENRTTGPIF
jgi:hypothetical protein